MEENRGGCVLIDSAVLLDASIPIVAVTELAPALAALGSRYRLAALGAALESDTTRQLESLGLRDYFDLLAGPVPEPLGDSKARIIAAALRALQSPGRAVLIGPGSDDVEAARANHLPCIGASWGDGARAILEDAGAASVIDTPTDLPIAIAALWIG